MRSSCAEYFPAGFHSAYGYHPKHGEQTTAQAYRIITLEVFQQLTILARAFELTTKFSHAAFGRGPVR